MTARVRRRCCRQMNLSPSATSARRLVPCSRGTRNRPCSSSITPTATAHSATDDAKAAATPTATSSPPSAGPMNSLAVSSAAWRRPLARESRLRGTTCGRIDWAHVSWTVSAAPRNSATAYSAQIDPLPNSTAATSTPRPMRAPRSPSASLLVGPPGPPAHRPAVRTIATAASPRRRLPRRARESRSVSPQPTGTRP